MIQISQNEIESEAGRTVVKKRFYDRSNNCIKEMTTARFVGAVKPNNCKYWFHNCQNLTEIKNIENLYTNQCCNMSYMFNSCRSLKEINLKYFETNNVTDMSNMFGFYGCNVRELTIRGKQTTIDKIKKANSTYSWINLCKWNIVN